MRSALISVDVQKDFCEGGALAVVGGAEVARKISKHIENEHGYDYLLASKCWHIDPGTHFSAEPDFVDSWPEHCPAGSEGAQFHPLLLQEFDAVFLKGQYSAAYSAFEGVESKLDVGLDYWLQAQEVDTLYVSGIALDFCVAATVRDSVRFGYDTYLIPDLTAAVDGEHFHNIWMDLQRETGCNIYVNP